MKKFLLDILNSYTLEEGQQFCLYAFRSDDNWPWGAVSDHRCSEQVADDFINLMDDPCIAGLWITIESGDGVTDHTVFKYRKHYGGAKLDVRK